MKQNLLITFYAFLSRILIALSGGFFWLITSQNKFAFVFYSFVLLFVLIAFAILELKKHFEKNQPIQPFTFSIFGTIGMIVPSIFDTIVNVHGESIDIVISSILDLFALMLSLFLAFFMACGFTQTNSGKVLFQDLYKFRIVLVASPLIFNNIVGFVGRAYKFELLAATISVAFSITAIWWVKSWLKPL